MFQIFSNELQERKLVQIKAVAVILAFVIIIFLLIIIISTIVIIIVIITTPAVLELASSQNQLYVIGEGSKPFWRNPSFWSRNIKDIMENFFSLTYLLCNHSRGIQLSVMSSSFTSSPLLNSRVSRSLCGRLGLGRPRPIDGTHVHLKWFKRKINL